MMNKQLVAKVFNEWMRRFTESPDEFEHEWQTVGRYIRETAKDSDPSYGVTSAEYFARLIHEMADEDEFTIEARPRSPRQ